jgi:heat shock protein HslJ
MKTVKPASTLFAPLLLASSILVSTTCAYSQTTPPASRGKMQTAKTPSLENTDWKLIWLDGSPVTPQQKEPHLLFDSNTHRVSGSGGCNQLTGSYQLTGNQLKFGLIASTMMACVQGMETEQQLLHSLPDVATWKITGQELELLNSAGKTLVRLRPLAPPAPSN